MGVVVRLAIALIGVAAVFFLYAWRSEIAPVQPRDRSAFDAGQIKQGAELAALGNCISCHTAPGGAPYAGGRPIDTPFGRIFATNITPDPATGIGRWSEAAFVRAVREGVSRDGHHLYPAFPYDHMTKMSEADVKAVYAFTMARQPVTAATPANDLKFPYNLRILVAGWKLLFFDRGEFKSDGSKSLVLNRGAYLVEGLAHCGACHTPRNAFGAEDKANAYGGAETGGWTAPALNANSPAAVPWTAERIAEYLRTGASPLHGVAAGPMAPVVQNLAIVPDADVQAMAAYVAAVAGPVGKERQEQADKAIARAQGQQATRSAGPSAGSEIYAGACAQCHGEAGRAPASPALNLALSSNVRGRDANNLIRIVLEGLHPADNTAGAFMPGFGAALTDKQVADLVDFVRASFTDRPAFAGVETRVRAAR